MARFSLVITRSITSAMVRAGTCPPGLGLARATVPNPLSNTPHTTTAPLCMFSLPSVGQAELNSHACREIDWLALALCRFELDLLRRPLGGLIESMTQTADDPLYLNAPVREKDHVQNYVAFDFQTAPFRSILRMQFFQNVYRRGGAFVVRRFFLRRFGYYRFIREAALMNGAFFRRAWGRIRNSVAETRARHGAANSFGASRAVTIAVSTGQCRRAQAVHVGPVVRITLARYSVGIAKSTGLHFVQRCHDCRGRGAPGR